MAYNDLPPLGQATSANSLPVVISSDQSAIDVEVTASALPTGAATETTLAAIETAVDGLETSNSAIETAVETIAGAVSGTEMQVDVLTLPGVQFQDVYVTGQGSQTALNQNVVLASAGTGSYDTLNGTTGISFRTVSLHIVPASGTVTAGVITFEGSNDNFVSTAAPLFLTDVVNVTAIPVSTVTLAANTPRYFTGAIPFRYFRARISTGITGTTTGVQCFSVFSPIPFSSPRLTVSQATAASLNVTATGTVATTMAANATTTPAKARDGVAGANDTGIPALHIRRDTPTAVTAAAGDWEPSQLSATGELWVRTSGQLADDAAFTKGTTAVIPIGGAAITMDGTDPGSVSAENDAAVPLTDPNRILLVNQTHPRFFRACADYASAQTNTSVVASPGASLSLYITDLVISNGATAGNITLLDGSGGSVIFEVYPAINGGVAHSFRNPIKLTAATALCITSQTVTTHSLTVTGYIAA